MEAPNVGDQYNLKWNNHLANFIQTFVEHQHGETLVDVTLSCEGRYIKAHRLILSACSDYFHSIFQVHAHLQHPIIFLNGIRFSDLKYILHFIYHGEVKVVDKDLPHVLGLGEALKIKGLSSVKLRDSPLEPTLPPPAKKSRSKKNSTEKNRKVKSPVPPQPLQYTKILPSPNEPLEVVNDVNLQQNPTDYSKIKVKRTKILMPMHKYPANSLPIITSVTSEAIPSSATPPIASDSPPLNSTDSVNNHPSRTENAPTVTTPTPKESSQIPNPPHAFMIFANEWRKKLTVEHPEENNKEISIRLGNMWKNLLPETKNIYYREAKRGEEEHKQKYPDYVSAGDLLKRKADVLNDSTGIATTKPPLASLDPMEVVETQEQITVTDSE